MIVPVSDYQVLSLHSEWIGNTQVRVKTRAIGNRRRIMVDMFILRPENDPEPLTSALVKIANVAANAQRIESYDHVWIRDFQFDQKSKRLDGQVTVTHVREITLAYQGY